MPAHYLSQKSRTRTQSEVTLPLSQQACGEKVGVSNYEAYNSGNLPHIPKLITSSHVHPFGIRNPKNHCFVNVILQMIHSVLRTTHQKMYFKNCVEGKISECLFDTAHKTPSAQEVETLKLQLSTYNNFFTGETQEGACECLMLLIEIMDKGFGLCPTIDNISTKGSFSEHLVSFVLKKYIIYDTCTVKSNLRLLKPPVCYMSPQLIVPPCRNYWCRSTSKNCIRPDLVVEGTLCI